MEASAGGARGQAPGGLLPPPVGGGAGPESTLEWTVSPWRENRGAAIASVLAAGALALLAARLLRGEGLAAVLLGLAALVALAPGMVGTRCRVDAAGVGRQVLFLWERRRWDDIRRARLAGGGLFVSPLARAGRLDRFRGLFLPLPGESRGGAELRVSLRRELDGRGL